MELVQSAVEGHRILLFSQFTSCWSFWPAAR